MQMAFRLNKYESYDIKNCMQLQFKISVAIDKSYIKQL